MEIKNGERLELGWRYPFNERLVQEYRKYFGPYITSDPKKIKTAFPELAKLLEQPAGTKLDIVEVTYDELTSEDPEMVPIPSLTRNLGYLIHIEAQLDAGDEGTKVYYLIGPNLTYQTSWSKGMCANPPISRTGNPNNYFKEEQKLRRIDTGRRFEETLRILVPQILTIKAVDTNEVLFYNQTLEKQLEEYERIMNQREVTPYRG